MKKLRQSKDITIESYTHEEAKRINNPPVGLVSSKTDVPDGKIKYQHDPHIDPQLDWAGKAEGISFEVPSVSLHIHERIDPTHIAKSFIKKRSQPFQQSLFEEQENELPLLKAIDFYKHEQEWSNRLIAGDSLLVMNSLLQKEGMAGKVQMIYIDPPYGIKYNSNFQPFLNKRDVSSNDDKDIPAEPEMIKAFRDTWELGIHSYLSHLHDRLLLAKELLNETGSCFVQIGEENVHLVRSILDETFGSDNFLSCISVVKTTGVIASTNRLNARLDYVLWYSKSAKSVKYHELFEERSSANESSFSQVELTDGIRRAMTREEKQNLSLLPRGARRFRYADLLKQGPGAKYEITAFGKTYSPGKKWWGTPKISMEKLISMRRVAPSGNFIYFVSFVDDFSVQRTSNLWTDTTYLGERLYVVQTPARIIERCLLMTTDPGDLALDPTCGGGTTAYVAEKWGRRWITCDTSRVAIALSKQRLMTANFDYYDLAHPDEGVHSGFQYKTVQHITLGSIANEESPQIETLYDQPLIDKKKIRVTGPFTVEAVPSLRVKPFDGSEAKINLQGQELVRTGETGKMYEWIDELKATGIRATGGKFLTFSRIEPLAGTKYLQAEGDILLDSGEMKKAVIFFGPDYGPLEQRQIEEAMKEVFDLQNPPDYAVFAAFHFDPEAAKDIDQINEAETGIILLKVQMSVDLLTSDLRKKRSSNQSYWLIGQPDIEIIKNEDGKYQVKVNGFDYYNPVTGEIEAGSEKQIAIWMIDTDYDEYSIFPDQIFFPASDANRDWTRLAKALNGAVDEDLLESFTGTTSVPFKAGENKKIAVKIIDNRGIESFVIKKL